MIFYKKKPQLGDKRTVVRFLWLPITLGNETHWLEFARVKQTYMKYSLPMPDRGPISVVGWKTVGWA